MQLKIKKQAYIQYICPFCKESIKASSKTDILYRNQWVKGCFNCFALSIDKKSMETFQQKSII